MENKIVVYQIDRAGLYVGPTYAYESPREPGVYHDPGGCIRSAPPPAESWPEGKWPRWNSAAWEFVTDPAIARLQIPAETALTKLQQFLSENPDVAALIGTSTPSL